MDETILDAGMRSRNPFGTAGRLMPSHGVYIGGAITTLQSELKNPLPGDCRHAYSTT